jgi:hypothetical protein
MQSPRAQATRRGPELGTSFIRSNQATSYVLLFSTFTSCPQTKINLLYYHKVLGNFQEQGQVEGWVYLNIRRNEVSISISTTGNQRQALAAAGQVTLISPALAVEKDIPVRKDLRVFSVLDNSTSTQPRLKNTAEGPPAG